MHEETEKRFCFFFQMIPPVLGKKGAKQNGKKVNRGAKRFWELFHHWVFCQSPTARHSFANCLGKGSVLLSPVSRLPVRGDLRRRKMSSFA